MDTVLHRCTGHRTGEQSCHPRVLGPGDRAYLVHPVCHLRRVERRDVFICARPGIERHGVDGQPGAAVERKINALDAVDMERHHTDLKRIANCLEGDDIPTRDHLCVVASL